MSSQEDRILFKIIPHGLCVILRLVCSTGQQTVITHPCLGLELTSKAKWLACSHNIIFTPKRCKNEDFYLFSQSQQSVTFSLTHTRLLLDILATFLSFNISGFGCVISPLQCHWVLCSCSQCLFSVMR